MQVQHSFFIVEEQNCVDKVKVLQTLAKNVFEGLECIYCFQSSFKKFEDVQRHMISKGHCMMNPDNLEEFKLCYDYSKENQEIYDKYIKSGLFREEDLEAFETLEVV